MFGRGLNKQERNFRNEVIEKVLPRHIVEFPRHDKSSRSSEELIKEQVKRFGN